jgi:hypothetical protein
VSQRTVWYRADGSAVWGRVPTAVGIPSHEDRTGAFSVFLSFSEIPSHEQQADHAPPDTPCGVLHDTFVSQASEWLKAVKDTAGIAQQCSAMTRSERWYLPIFMRWICTQSSLSMSHRVDNLVGALLQSSAMWKALNTACRGAVGNSRFRGVDLTGRNKFFSSPCSLKSPRNSCHTGSNTVLEQISSTSRSRMLRHFKKQTWELTSARIETFQGISKGPANAKGV